VSSLWRHREFRKFWAGAAISDVGSQVTLLAVPLIAALTLQATPWQMGSSRRRVGRRSCWSDSSPACGSIA